MRCECCPYYIKCAHSEYLSGCDCDGADDFGYKEELGNDEEIQDEEFAREDSQVK